MGLYNEISTSSLLAWKAQFEVTSVALDYDAYDPQTQWLIERGAVSQRRDFQQFVETVGMIPMRLDQIKGNVLYAGTGEKAPERILLYELPDFKVQRSEVDSISVCDHNLEYYKSHGHLTDFSMTVTRDVPQNLQFEHNTAVGYSMRLDRFLIPVKPDTFDTVLFLRIPSLEDQLSSGLMKLISERLKPGGFFIGSGAFIHGGIEIPNTLIPHSIVLLDNLERISPGEEWGYDNYHIGFVLQKKPELTIE